MVNPIASIQSKLSLITINNDGILGIEVTFRVALAMQELFSSLMVPPLLIMADICGPKLRYFHEFVNFSHLSKMEPMRLDEYTLFSLTHMSSSLFWQLQVFPLLHSEVYYIDSV